MSEASLIATDTSAAASAGASFMPSPTIITQRPCFFSASMWLCLSSGRTCACTSVIPSCCAIFSAAELLSPVSITTFSMPHFFISATALAASGRGGSIMHRTPARLPPTARKITDDAPAVSSIFACCSLVIVTPSSSQTKWRLPITARSPRRVVAIPWATM